MIFKAAVEPFSLAITTDVVAENENLFDFKASWSSRLLFEILESVNAFCEVNPSGTMNKLKPLLINNIAIQLSPWSRKNSDYTRPRRVLTMAR